MVSEVGASRAMVAVSWPVKARLNGLRLDMQKDLGRQVSFAEVLEALLAEHDVHKEVTSP